MAVKKYEDLTREELEIYRKFYEWQRTGWNGVPSILLYAGGDWYRQMMAANAPQNNT